MSGNPRGHLYIVLTPIEALDTAIIRNDEVHGENEYFHPHVAGTPYEGFQLPPKVDRPKQQYARHTFASAETKNVWCTEDLEYFNKFFLL